MLVEPASSAHQLLALNLNPEPNYLSHLLLAGLLTVLPPWLAEKVILTACVAGLPLALRYLLRANQQAAGWLVVLGFPFIYSALFLWGFYNFCLSLVLLLLALGYWQRLNRTGQRAGIGGLVVLITLLYAANPLTYLVSGLLLGLLVVAQSQPGGLPTFFRRVGRLLLAYLPTLPLLCWYFWHKGTATSAPAQHYGENFWNWLHLEPIAYLGSAGGTYRWLVTGLLAVAVAGAVGQLIRLKQQLLLVTILPWAVGTVLLLGAYVILPDAMSGGSIIRPRWGLLSYLTLLSALSVVPWPARLRTVLLGAGTIVAILFLGFRLQKFQALQSGLAEYRSAGPYLRSGTTLLPLTYAAVTRMPNGAELGTYINVFSHAASYLCVDKQVFDYENYEADTGYFPLLWQPCRAPLLQQEQFPARLAPVLYQPNQAPTYLLLWGRKVAAPTNAANARQIAAYLARFNYELHFRSATGLLELYQLPQKISE